MKKRPIAIALFSGAGGMSLGFEQAGFDIPIAIEVDLIHAKTYQINFPNCCILNKDISKINGTEVFTKTVLKSKNIDVLFGGPPCQGFSLIGKRRADDSRNKLVYQFARLVGEIRPNYFVMENVEGFLLGKASEVADSFIRRVKKAGYSIVTPIQTLDASDFKVPQKRKRVFILGFKKDLAAPIYPKPIRQNKINKNVYYPCVWDAIGDLPNVDEFDFLIKTDVYSGCLGIASDYALILRGEKRDFNDRSKKRKKSIKGLTGCLRIQHKPKTIERFVKTAPGCIEPISRYHRLSKDGLAPTLRAGTGSSNGSYTAPRPIHPVYSRCITVREAARLHSYPDWFQFHPTKWHGFRQVGNSVPPLLARAVAKSIIKVIKG
jgi:DNA (cytosine-5)-methyltransferase 1